jgi:predicted nucleic acid-binding protein
LRVAFDTTVLWGAFLKPAGANFSLLALAAQRTPVLDGFVTDAVGAEFWWRATQQGVKRPGGAGRRVYSEEEIAAFLDVFGDLFEPASLAQAPLGRSLGRFAGLVGRPLGEVLHAITGKDREALVDGLTTTVPVTFESIDIADLHVVAGAIDNNAELLCTNDSRTLGYDPIGSLRVVRASDLANELGLIDTSVPATDLG